jgi:hypothetical protein
MKYNPVVCSAFPSISLMKRTNFASTLSNHVVDAPVRAFDKTGGNLSGDA